MAIKDLFEDYKEENVGSKICIELEVAKRDSDRIVSTHQGTLWGKQESSKIFEICEIHQLPTEDRIKIYDDVRKKYKNRFPVGRDTYLSGGTHFHAFFKQPVSGYADKLRSIDVRLSRNDLYSNYLALPLYMKVQNYKFVGRPNAAISSTVFNDYYTNNSPLPFHELFSGRASYGGLRSSFRSHNTMHPNYMSMEFRCNNVVDTRLYGYYIGQLLLLEAGVKLPSLSVDIKLNAQHFRSTYQYMKNLEGTTITTKQDKDLLKQNLTYMLDLLQANDFPVAAQKLHEYAREVKLI